MYFSLKQEVGETPAVRRQEAVARGLRCVREKRMRKNLVRAVSALTLSLPVSTMSAQALELKVADSFPAGHYLVRLMLKPWMDDVTKRTNGAVTFSYLSEPADRQSCRHAAAHAVWRGRYRLHRPVLRLRQD